MPVYKDKKNNTWYVKGRYKDWTGKTKDLMKRGFALKREAVEWEENFRLRLDSSLNMSFADFYQIYKEDLGARLKDSTWETKAAIIETKLLPFFGAMRLRDITSVEVIRWQNEMMKQKMPITMAWPAPLCRRQTSVPSTQGPPSTTSMLNSAHR